MNDERQAANDGSESTTARAGRAVFKWDRNTRIFIDTSSLMEGGGSDFIEGYLEPRLAKVGQKLAVPTRVIDELKRKAASPDDERLRERGTAGLRALKALQDRGTLEIYGEPNDSFADNVFIAVFTRYRTQRKLVLVTQDRALAAEILRLGSSGAVRDVKGIEAIRVGRGGGADRWELDASEPTGVRYSPILVRRPMPPPSPKATNPFAVASAVATVPVNPLPMTLRPTEGHVLVDAKGRRYPLRKLLGQGGEGSVFQSDDNLVCKVYKPERATAFAKAKLDLMTSRTLDYPGLCWPRAVLYNERREFVGYAMSRAAGKEIQKTIFIKPIFATTFPKWDKSNLVSLAISILRVIDFLHAHNVLVGDLNPRNILIEDDRRVYFVDTDSFQVEGFPSPVGMPPFLAPSLFGADLSKTLRDIDQENFAIATLMFMLMVPGKPPYSHCGGLNPAENVLRGHFPYALGEKHGKDAPEGPWVLIWGNLPFYMKEAFTEVFEKGTSLSVADWGELMTRYRSDLQKLNEEGKPRVPRDLFPTTYKPLSRKVVEKEGGIWLACAYHGGEFGWFPKGKQRQPPNKPMCRDCAMKKVAVTCSTCGTVRLAIPLPEYVKTYEKGLPVVCEDCRNGRAPAAPACNSCGTRTPLLPSGVCPACDARARAASAATTIRRPTTGTAPPPPRPALAPPPPTVVRQPKTWVEEFADWLSGLLR